MSLKRKRLLDELDELPLNGRTDALPAAEPGSQQRENPGRDFAVLLVGQEMHPLIASLLHQLTRQRRQLDGVDVVPG